VTGPLTDAHVEDLIALVGAALDAGRDYERAWVSPVGATIEARMSWDQRVSAAHEAAVAAERAAMTAILALRGAS
jgi:hypothetical protein